MTHGALTFASFGGTLHHPGSEGFDAARAVWNGQVDRRPRLVATCADTRDVAIIVRHAVAAGLPLSVRSGGHHVAGSAVVDDGVVVDLSAMNGVVLDGGRVVVEGGAKLGDIDRAILPGGRLVPVGIDPDTGVGGLTLGGGLGWSMRRHGLACDNLVGVQMVTAAGDVIRVDDSTDPDLMWGLRGGGGNFGIVTEFTFDSHPVADRILAGFAVYRGVDAPAVLRHYRTVVADAPDELTTIVFLRIAPPAPWVPPHVVGDPVVMVGATWLGDIAAGERVIAPLRSLARPVVDTIRPKPMLEHQAVLDGANPVGHRYYWKSLALPALTDGTIDLLAAHLDTISSPHSLLGFFQMGGSVARLGEKSCFPNRDTAFLINYAVHWTDRSEDEMHRAWTRRAIADLEPHATGSGYLNFQADGGLDAVRRMYGMERYPRLVTLKNRFDPDNVFRHNQNIPPS